MTDDRKSEPAFPETYSTDMNCIDSIPGLTKRELIAAMAMQGILANSEFLRNHKDADIHKAAVFNADALLKELSKRESTDWE